MATIVPKRLYLKELPTNVNEDEIKAVINTFSEVKEVKMMPSQTYAFVTFASSEDAQGALDGLRDNGFHGKPIIVEFAHPLRKDHAAVAATNLNPARLYIRDLPDNVASQIMEDLLQQYGTLIEFKVRAGLGHKYGFVEYAAKDAKTVFDTFNRYSFLGKNITVEFAYHSRKALSPASKVPKRRTYARFRVIVAGIPRHCCWQELKDFGRLSGRNVIYCDLEKSRNGRGYTEFWDRFLEFASHNDALIAIRELNGKMMEGVKVAVFLASTKNVSKATPIGDYSRSRVCSAARLGDISNTRALRRSRSRSPQASYMRYLPSESWFSSMNSDAARAYSTNTVLLEEPHYPSYHYNHEIYRDSDDHERGYRDEDHDRHSGKIDYQLEDYYRCLPNESYRPYGHY